MSMTQNIMRQQARREALTAARRKIAMNIMTALGEFQDGGGDQGYVDGLERAYTILDTMLAKENENDEV